MASGCMFSLRLIRNGTAEAIPLLIIRLYNPLLAFPVREAFIELLQHFQRLLSAFCSSDYGRLPSFALAVREAFIELFQHFQRLLSLSYLSCSLRTIV